MPKSFEIKAERATLKLVSKDINQIFLVGKSVVVDGNAALKNEFTAMFTRLDSLLSDYNSTFKSCSAIAIELGDETSFPTKDDFAQRKETLGLYYKAVEFHQSLSSSGNTNTSLNQTVSRSRLPKISVPKFSGCLSDWPNFKQLFLSMIHHNLELPVIEKYFYLADALVGEAKTVIATFMVDEQNYLPAWEALLKRYDNKRLLATSYIDQVLNFPLPKGPCDVLSLQSFLRVIAENVTAFKNIQIENEADFLLLTLALQKLDPETQQQFETKHVNNTWPSFKDLVDFVHGKCQVLQLTKQLNEQSPKGLRPSKTVTRSQVLTTTSNSTLPQISSNKGSLCNCRQQHHLFECPFFRNMFPTKRKLFLRNKKVCFNCLKPGHYVSDCSSTGRCRACKAKHHTLLHESSFGDLRKDPPQQSVPQEVKPSTSISPSDSKQEGNTIIASVTGPAQVLLGTAEIFIPNSEGIPQPVRLLIDCGSQLSLITASCAKRLGLAWRATNHNLIAAGQTPMSGVKGRLCCHLQSRVYPDQKLEANPFVVQAITGELPTAPLNSQLADQLQPLLLADPLFWKPRQVDFLLGNDLFMKIIRSSPQPLSSDYGSIPTIFGLILMGNVAPTTSASGSSHCLCLTESPISAELINRFWEMEEVSSNSIAPQHDPCEQHFLKTHYRDASGRYVVSLPFKEPPSGLTESIELAYSRFQNLESQLKRKPFIKDKYINFMEEYHKLGHMAPTREPSAFVIPHHSVFKLSESKLRVVFDASMRTSSGSLNDKLHVGRKLQLDITDIILNFRRHVVAITADLIKMYRQILLNPSDRKYQHILWRSSPADPLITYELKTVTYGTASAPFTALRTIQQLVNYEGHSYPLVAHLLVKPKILIKRLLDAVSISEVTYFTDSTIVLAWLGKSPHELQTFIANRVACILNNSEACKCYHITSAENPADLASRGSLPEELIKNSSWWAAPEWLQQTPLILSRPPELPDKVPELRPHMSFVLSCDEGELMQWMSRHSNYSPMTRTLAYMLRFIGNLRSPQAKRIFGPLLPKEIDNALIACVKAVQQFHFAKEFCWKENKALSKRLLTLSAFVDENGVIRVGGRLANADLPYQGKHPAILPGNAHLTRLLIDHYHLVHYHLGSQALQAFLRQRFWIFRLRQTVRSRLAKCLTCFRMKAHPVHPFMGNLPTPRVRTGRPFITTGVDYAGPFSIKQGSRRTSPISKAYLSVFVCFATKAVHLEIVSSLSTEAFLAAFDRFIARRGLPQRIYSDCGKNFVGAAHALQAFFAWIKDQKTQETILRHTGAKGIQWMFIPPYAPHFGGLWEAAVKSAKYHLCRVIKDTTLTFEELTTLTSRVEAVLNSRPLCPLNDDPEYGDYLTPGHFLIGAPLIALPEEDLSHLTLNRLSRWQLIKNSVQHFWKAWSTEYLHTLQRRPK